MASKSNSRSQGGGRTSNSEPRVQVFKDFAGVNFQESPREFVHGSDVEPDQTNLQMNYMAVQNNVRVCDNKTLETRADIRKIVNGTFSGPAITFNNYIFASNGSTIYCYDLDTGSSSAISYVNNYGTTPVWEDLAVANGQLVALADDGRMFTGEMNGPSTVVSNVPPFDRSNALSFEAVVPKGNLKVSEENTDEFGFRIGLQFTYLSKFGPSLPSEPLYFYANKPTTEWNAQDYLTIVIPAGMYHAQHDFIIGAEIYYTEGTYQDFTFLEHLDFTTMDAMVFYDYDWFGVSDIDSTEIWAISNLTVPTENYTAGAPVSRIDEIDGRLYMYGDPGKPYRLYIGGNPGNEFSISRGTGGGFVDVNPGSGEEIRKVVKYKTQSGNSIVSFLCGSENTSREKRYNLVENAVTLSNEQSVKGWQAEEVSGAVGTRSFEGVLVCEDGLYTVNRYGLALTTLTMEYNSQIKVNFVSQAIEPVFHDDLSERLKRSIILNINGIIYFAVGGEGAAKFDDALFCYDTGLKAWWSYTLDGIGPILNMFHVDYEQHQEGIGLVTDNGIYLMPTTQTHDTTTVYQHDFIIETAEMATSMPQQQWQHITQFQFEFDHFVGDMRIEFIAIDQFGRKITTVKNISASTTQYGLTEWMRIDLKVRSYKLRFTGRANFRLTHFMAKTYTLSNKVGIVWGFDSSQGKFGSTNNIRRYFKNYNDVKESIIP